MHLGYIPHPLTIFNNVEKFPAAHYLCINIDQYNFNTLQSGITGFWKPELSIDAIPLKDETKAKSDLKDLLRDAVAKQLVSDVPIGTFLSGGIDSSLVTAIACEVSPQKINTFSIAIDDGKFNESKYAKQVATHLNTEHHEFSVKEKEIARTHRQSFARVR